MNNEQNNNVIKPGENNNVVAQPVTPVAPTTPTQPATPVANQIVTPVANTVVNDGKTKKQINKKTIIIAVAVLVGIFIVYNVFLKGAVSFNVGIGKNNQQKQEEKIQLKLKDEWANKYALSVQDLFNGRDSFDLAFYDLDFDTNPEAIVSYVENDVENKIVYSLDGITGNVANSKKFSNSTINILYSLEDSDAYWFLKVTKRDNYVTYTRLSKVIEGTVMAPDIDCTTDKLLNDFKNKYVVSEFKPIFYTINKKSFEKDYTTIYERYDEYDEKVKDEIADLKTKYADSKIERKTDENSYLQLDDFRVSYATFTGKKVEIIDNERKETTLTLEIKNDGTLILEGKEYKYTTVNNVINIDNGKVLTASKDNVLTYNDYEGVIFTTDAVLPEKDNNQNNNQDQNNNQNN